MRHLSAGQPILLRPECLEFAHSRAEAGEPRFAVPLEELVREADAGMDAGSFSVMDKDLVPPSGDKHDFRCQAGYHWPNHSTPDGLPYVRRDGEKNPEDFRDETSDRNRKIEMIRLVWASGLAYFFTREEKYAARAALLLRTWFLDPETRMNPNLNFAGGIPGVCDGRHFGIIQTAAFTQVVDAALLLEDSPAWTAEDREGLRRWFSEYVSWLGESGFGRAEGNWRNNHATWYDVQVSQFAMFCGRPEIAEEILSAAGERRIATQIEPDGSMPVELGRTKTLGYTCYNLRAMFALCRLGEHFDIDLWNYRAPSGACIRAALDYVAPCADLDREWPHRQIAPVDRTEELYPLLLRACRAYGEDGYREFVSKLPAEARMRSRANLLYSV